MTTAAKFLFGEEPEDETVKPKVPPSAAFMRELKRMYPMGATVEPLEPDDESEDGGKKSIKLAALLTLLGED